MGVLLRLLVHVLAEIHDPADGRRDVGGDLDQIKIELLRELERLAGGQDAELLALRADDADLLGLDTVIATDVCERIRVATRGVAGAATGRKCVSHQSVSR